MTTESIGRASEPSKLLALCEAIAERSPVPTAEIDPATRTLRCVNLAFSLLVGKTKHDLAGSLLASIVPEGVDCLTQLERVRQTGAIFSSAGKEQSLPVIWTYTLWPVISSEHHISAVILQVTEATVSGQNAVVMNQALLLGALRQDELLETAELLNTQLRAEMAARKMAEDVLVRTEKLAVAGRMAAVLAHEINNPLAAVMDLVYLLQDWPGIPVEASVFLEKADGELQRIAHIARQTLGFYRDSAGASTFPLKPLLASIVDLLKAKIRSTAATVELQCDDTVRMRARYGELRQVCSNLLLNSLEAVGERGRVILRASFSINPKDGRERVRITVADNGCGMEVKVLHHLFEAFYTTKGEVGNGLGLWVSKQIVHNHNGVFSVRSNTHGARRGTTFSIALPVSAISEQPQVENESLSASIKSA